MSLKTLWLKIKGDNAGLNSSLKQSEGALGKFKKSALKLGAALVGVFAVGKIISFGKEVVGLAAKAQGIRAAFERLNEPALLANLREATRGTVDDITLMQKAVQAKNFKIPLDQLATYFKFATNRAIETGESIDYMVESLITGVGRKSVLVMDNLGISAVELQEETKRLGDFGAAAGAIIQRELAKSGDVADTASTKFAKINTAWANMKERIGDVILESGALQTILTKLEAAFIKVFSVLFPDAADDLKTIAMLEADRVKEIGEMEYRYGLIKDKQDEIAKRTKFGLQATAKQINYLDRQLGFYNDHKDRLEEINALLEKKNSLEETPVNVPKQKRAAPPLSISGKITNDFGIGAVVDPKAFRDIGFLSGEAIMRGIIAGVQAADLAEATVRLSDELKNMVSEAAQVVGDFIGMTFEAIGSGDYSNLGKDLLGGFADFLSNLGRMMVALGVLESAFYKGLAAGPAGVAILIGAGLAAIAVAGLIKGSLANAGSAMSGSSSGGGGSYGGGNYGGGVNTTSQSIEIFGKLKGSDIVISSQRYTNGLTTTT